MEELYSDAPQLTSINSLMTLNNYRRMVGLNWDVVHIRDSFNAISIVQVVKMVSFVFRGQKCYNFMTHERSFVKCKRHLMSLGGKLTNRPFICASTLRRAYTFELSVRNL